MAVLAGAVVYFAAQSTSHEAQDTDFLTSQTRRQIIDDTAIIETGATIGEVSCPTVYTPEASSINFRRSVKYGFGCLGAAIRFRLAKLRFRLKN